MEEFKPLSEYPELFEVQYTSDPHQPGASVWSGDWNNADLMPGLVPKVLSMTLFMLEGSARRLQTPPSGPVAALAYRDWVGVAHALVPEMDGVLSELRAPERYGVSWDTARLLMFTRVPFTAYVVTWYTRDEQNRGYTRGDIRLVPNQGAKAVLYDSQVNTASMLDRFIIT
jgi:hypothetical protein